MNALNLPDPIAAYFCADREGPAAVARCFTPDAVVTDEGRSHAGRDAIGRWHAAAKRAFPYTVEPLAIACADGVHRVTARVRGTFPGSPVVLHHAFRVADGRIASLEIAP